ncbi:unnamed protein product [Vitrella brassicaformis CCMP3155]|uniref:protein-ribulosamine 3-kinase n=1 Tax=Vitrella brassicaformis (strain CCMP3155) TaxID=1169540 RepID=A0A0G4H7A3_VITBC|nr:unnamed protein product [Vitrella brassicaformis CCMP3155]|eukprot:CEM39525.1 unnamed protein product [Vitrella brassicaformis CCMP3155]
MFLERLYAWPSPLAVATVCFGLLNAASASAAAASASAKPTSSAYLISSSSHQRSPLPHRSLPLSSMRASPCPSAVCMTASTATLLQEALSEALTQALGHTADVELVSGGGGGGGGASVGIIVDKSTGTKYFYKSAGSGASAQMLEAEYKGVKDMADTKTIKVPDPICYGTFGNGGSRSFVIFEQLNMGRSGGGENARRMGTNLANMHRSLSPNAKFGWHMDNTIGATPQPNQWCDTWVDFWDEHRLGHMLRLANIIDSDKERKLRAKVKDILSKHTCQPSLVHGDLWTGNAGYLSDGTPVIFDPATYYGDREVDIAMSQLFGRLSGEFYKAYDEAWPLPPGHQTRKESIDRIINMKV